jgi:hypothetical protein
LLILPENEGVSSVVVRCDLGAIIAARWQPSSSKCSHGLDDGLGGTRFSRSAGAPYRPEQANLQNRLLADCHLWNTREYSGVILCIC